MSIQTVIEKLNNCIQLLAEESLAEIDFTALKESLSQGVEFLNKTIVIENAHKSLIKLIKDDMLQKSRAIARLKGGSSNLIEKMITASSLNFEELLQLKQEIENEFNLAFSRNISVPTSAANVGDNASDYKV